MDNESKKYDRHGIPCPCIAPDDLPVVRAELRRVRENTQR